MATLNEFLEGAPAWIDAEAVEAYYNEQPSYWDTCEVSEFVESLEEAYVGRYDSDEEFAQELAEGIGEMPSDNWPHCYIDWERASADLLMCDYFTSDRYYFRTL